MSPERELSQRLIMSISESVKKLHIPKGFRWGTAAAKIKRAGRDDIAILYADEPVSTAAVFTQNRFCAAPVALCREVLEAGGGKTQGVIANSGNANAATGEPGLANARAMTVAARAATNSQGRFLVCSTGTIGVQLPMERVAPGIEAAAAQCEATADAFEKFAKAILTTDTVEKMASAEFSLGNKSARIAGCAKGSGMMHPNMATLLAFIMTDVDISPALLDECLRGANEKSLNCITIDGDTSTNDTAILFASGKSGLSVIKGSESQRLFEEHLLAVMQSLAKQLARDGEGATKLIEIHVQRAASFEQARQAGLAIGNSNLVKTAIYGRDANWGRIVCALGYSGVPIDPDKVSVQLGDLMLYNEGAPLALDEDRALEILSQDVVIIEVALGLGDESATVWSCDLTEKYIEINGSYRT